MTRTRTQLLIMVVYLVFGSLALLTPGIVMDILGIPAADRSPVALLMTRAFGAASLGVALALFFFIADATSGRRMMRALAGLEAAVVVAAILSLGADDLSTRAGFIVAALSGALALLNLYGGFLAPLRLEDSRQDE